MKKIRFIVTKTNTTKSKISCNCVLINMNIIESIFNRYRMIEICIRVYTLLIDLLHIYECCNLIKNIYTALLRNLSVRLKYMENIILALMVENFML